MTTMSNLLCDLNFVFDALCAFVHKSTLLSIPKIIFLSFPDVEGRSSIIRATQYESRAAGGLAPPAGCPSFSFFFSFHRLRLLARPIFFQLCTFSHSPHSPFISQSLANPLPPSRPHIKPPSHPPAHPLALMLMHSQSGCPLGRRALHVHQAVRRPCMQMNSNCSVRANSLKSPSGRRGEAACERRAGESAVQRFVQSRRLFKKKKNR